MRTRANIGTDRAMNNRYELKRKMVAWGLEKQILVYVVGEFGDISEWRC
jgi:hypothetical protein